MWLFFCIFALLKQMAMKRKETKNIGFAGYKKNPVAVFAPVCFGIDIVFLWFYYGRFVMERLFFVY